MTGELSDALAGRVAELARELLGEPNRALSNGRQLRWGRHGSLAVEVAGERAGDWYDHEAGVGGGPVELIQRARGCPRDEALAWARRWAGLDDPAAADRADPLAGTVPIAGTPAERYLRSRAIELRAGAAWPSCLRWRAPLGRQRHGALIALATDAAGRVLAWQEIYVGRDGRRAEVSPRKRTRKRESGWTRRAAVRLPGERPIVLAEGVETALAVWCSTGRETWSTLGVGNLASAPVPDGAEVVIARDADAPGSQADRAVARAVRSLEGRGCRVAVARPPTDGDDWNDVLQMAGAAAVAESIDRAIAELERPPPAEQAWRAGLLVDDQGRARSWVANARLILAEDPRWSGVLAYDLFARRAIVVGPLPWSGEQALPRPWTDADDTLTVEWLQRHYGLSLRSATIAEVVEVVARQRTVHPLQDYLRGLVWDGTPRIATWLVRYLGAADTPYVRAVGERWLIALVARALRPGCKADAMLVLEGPQGIGKSSVFSILGGVWYSDRISALHDKDAMLDLLGVWIVELSELDVLSRAEAAAVKAFISRTHDHFRPPYGRRAEDYPRQCVFGGTINPEHGYLRDATGARRFWPVRCGQIDLETLARDRDQLFAEAVAAFEAGEPWWLGQELEAAAAEEQGERYQDDPWEAAIAEHVAALADVSIQDILGTALQIERSRWTQADHNRVARVLLRLGWERYQRRDGAKRQWRYRRRVQAP